MFDRELALRGPWRTWTAPACEDQNLVLSLVHRHDGVVFRERLAYYRTHNEPAAAQPPLRCQIGAAWCFDSHLCIDQWMRFGRRTLGLSRFTLAITQMKTVVLKDRSSLEWLHEQGGPSLQAFLDRIRRLGRLRYWLLAGLNPRMIAHHRKRWPATVAGRLAGRLLAAALWIGCATVLLLDLVVHPPGCGPLVVDRLRRFFRLMRRAGTTPSRA